ncbi:MAG: hypothetical protein KC708_22335 [Anaerolineae bacterium]|nr:hypothetical protein [Anaerolineae bacterium]
MEDDLRLQIINWLKEYFWLNLSTTNIQVWLIGSVAANKHPFGDCDILVIYPEKFLPFLIQHTSNWKHNFARKFSIDLHITSLTTEEFKEPIDILDRIVNGATLLLFPYLNGFDLVSQRMVTSSR